MSSSWSRPECTGSCPAARPGRPRCSSRTRRWPWWPRSSRPPAGACRWSPMSGRPGTAATARLIEAAIAAGAAGVSAIVPYYYALGDREIVAHFRVAAARGGRHAAVRLHVPRAHRQRAQRRGVQDAGGGRAGRAEGLDERRRASTRATWRRRRMRRSSSARPRTCWTSLRGGSRGGVAALANLRPGARPRARRRVAGRARRGRRAAPGGGPRGRARCSRTSAPLVALKRGVSELMAERGARYPAALRSPLGA